MAALWQFGTVDIFVTDAPINREVKRAELFILGATESTFHFFGVGSYKRPVKGLVIGTANALQLLSDFESNTARTFTTPYGTNPNYRIDKDIKLTIKQYAAATIDGVDYTVDVTPIYDLEMTLIYAP